VAKAALNSSRLILRPFYELKPFCLKFCTILLLSLPSKMEEKIWPRMRPNFILTNRLLALKMPKAMQRTVFLKHSASHYLAFLLALQFQLFNLLFILNFYIARVYLFFSFYSYFALKFSTKFKFLE
jgi:hypothetical protein